MCSQTCGCMEGLIGAEMMPFFSQRNLTFTLHDVWGWRNPFFSARCELQPKTPKTIPLFNLCHSEAMWIRVILSTFRMKNPYEKIPCQHRFLCKLRHELKWHGVASPVSHTVASTHERGQLKVARDVKQKRFGERKRSDRVWQSDNFCLTKKQVFLKTSFLYRPTFTPRAKVKSKHAPGQHT